MLWLFPVAAFALLASTKKQAYYAPASPPTPRGPSTKPLAPMNSVSKAPLILSGPIMVRNLPDSISQSPLPTRTPLTSGPQGRPNASAIILPLLNLIAQAEANAGYDSYYSAARVRPAKPVSTMTIREVQAWQRANLNAGSRSTAVGRYQFISQTLNGLIAELGVAQTELFNSGLQNRFAIQLLYRRGLQRFLDGLTSEADFIRSLSQEWAGLPKDAGGQSYYAGQAGNRANVSHSAVVNAVRGFG